MDGQAITTKSDLERILLDRSMEAKAKRLSFSLLESITKSFSDEQQIGRGGFAVVYKGLLEHGEVAVKKLRTHQNCIDDDEKFIGEVRCLMKAKHKNIVRFLGYCSDTQGEWVEHNGQSVMADVRQRLLCFEYIPNGSLDKYIEDASREWGTCYKIIKGVCEGLQYLHEERIVHRDLTPANILLDDDMVPKITDFGISKCFDKLQTHHFTSKLVGAWGYIAPELFHNRRITFKSDIYNLGTIITEILTGDNKGRPKVEKVQEHWSHKLEGSQKGLQLEQIRVCTEVAQSCLEYNPDDRPSAQKIICTLKRTEREEWCIEPGASSHNPRSTLKRTEREEWCIEPGASSHNPRSSLVVLGGDCCKSDAAADAATPLGSTVAATNMSKKQQRRLFKVARTIELLMQTISKFYGRDAKDIFLEERLRDTKNMDMIFEELRRGVYDLVVIHKKGEELYSAAETTMASEVQSLCRPLDDDAAPADSALFLQELLTKWDLHVRALRLIGCIFFGYMVPIKQLGLRLWCDEMARSDKIRPRLVEALKRQKGGEDELVPGVNKMLTWLGMVPSFASTILCSYCLAYLLSLIFSNLTASSVSTYKSSSTSFLTSNYPRHHPLMPCQHNKFLTY